MNKELRCPKCQSNKMVRAGFFYGAKGQRKQKYLCNNCRKITLKPKKGGK